MNKPNRKNSRTLLYLMLIGLFVFTCQPNEDIVEITFGFNAVEGESIQPLIDQFNQKHKGKIKVNWEKTSVISNEFYAHLEKDFKSKKAYLDVFGADVVWTATFASNNWVENLSPKFYSEYNPSDFVVPALRSAIYDFKTWGVPWYTDTGIIFMRKDLLEKHNLNTNPATWAELKSSAKKVMAESDIKYGYVFQGADYEGGVANACEFIWSTNGKVMLGDLFVPEGGADKDIPKDIIVIDSKEAEAGFTLAYSLIKEGITPAIVADFREQESIEAFQNGDAVFFRGWPANYSTFLKLKSKISPAQVAVCPLPSMAADSPSNSCLGGWNLMINAQSSTAKKEAAWTFIKFMTDVQQQKFRALTTGNLPTLKSLYEDPEILSKVPTVKLAKASINKARSRPVSSLYRDLAPKISETFNRVLKGEIEPAYAVSLLQMELEGIEDQKLSANEQ